MHINRINRKKKKKKEVNMYMYIIINIFYSNYCNNVKRKTENEILKLCTIKSILCRFLENLSIPSVTPKNFCATPLE